MWDLPNVETEANHPLKSRHLKLHDLFKPDEWRDVDMVTGRRLVLGNADVRKGSGIGQGSISLHPGGHAHGPQPGAYERSIGVEYLDELAVMVDTFQPLELGEAAEDPLYPWTWARKAP